VLAHRSYRAAGHHVASMHKAKVTRCTRVDRLRQAVGQFPSEVAGGDNRCGEEQGGLGEEPGGWMPAAGEQIGGHTDRDERERRCACEDGQLSGRVRCQQDGRGENDSGADRAGGEPRRGQCGEQCVEKKGGGGDGSEGAGEQVGEVARHVRSGAVVVVAVRTSGGDCLWAPPEPQGSEDRKSGDAGPVGDHCCGDPDGVGEGVGSTGAVEDGGYQVDAGRDERDRRPAAERGQLVSLGGGEGGEGGGEEPAPLADDGGGGVHVGLQQEGGWSVGICWVPVCCGEGEAALTGGTPRRGVRTAHPSCHQHLCVHGEVGGHAALASFT